MLLEGLPASGIAPFLLDDEIPKFQYTHFKGEILNHSVSTQTHGEVKQINVVKLLSHYEGLLLRSLFISLMFNDMYTEYISIDLWGNCSKEVTWNMD